MTEVTLCYALPRANWRIRFPPHVLETLSTHRQKSSWSKEAFGQMFSRNLATSDIVVDLATSLSPLRSSFASLSFAPSQLEAERNRLFARGLHCLGIWHSHAEPVPTPSSTDQQLMRDHSRAALAQVQGVVFAIVGTSRFPEGLGVYVDDGSVLRAARIVRPDTT